MAKKKTVKDATIAEEKVKKNKKEELEEVEEVEEIEEVEEDLEDLEEQEEKESKKESKSEKNTIRKEMKKVVWPKGAEIVKYTFAVLVFCIVLALFFEGCELLMAFIKGLFN